MVERYQLRTEDLRLRHRASGRRQLLSAGEDDPPGQSQCLGQVGERHPRTDHEARRPVATSDVEDPFPDRGDSTSTTRSPNPAIIRSYRACSATQCWPPVPSQYSACSTLGIAST